MNPFDLPGPQFLAFYTLFGAATLALVYQARQWAEAGEPVRLPSSDPYVIAYLRGGAEDAVRLGVAVLVDRQLLVIGTADTVSMREGVRPMHGSNDLERAILEECERDTYPRDLVTSQRLQGVARRSYEPLLHRLRLLADAETYQRRLREAGVAVFVLTVVAAIKVAIGISRHRPVSFLVIAAIVFSALALVLTRGRRTVLGDRVLGDLSSLFDALRDRARELRPYTATNELALLMAVFGLEAVPIMAFPFRRAFRPAASNSSSCGTATACGSSSGGSSCGGGGSSCGGGGGGCGGCGSS